jgi:hypothetical protein
MPELRAGAVRGSRNRDVLARTGNGYCTDIDILYYALTELQIEKFKRNHEVHPFIRKRSSFKVEVVPSRVWGENALEMIGPQANQLKCGVAG